MQENRKTIYKGIRLPADLKVKIEKVAKKKRWSFHQTMIILLEDGVK